MNSKKMRRMILAGSLATAALTNFASAQTNDNKPPPPQDGEHGQRREPPPQAYEDCKGKKEGDVVMITPPHKDKIAATCTSSPKGLFARPERPPHSDGHDDNAPPPPKK